VKLDIFLVGGLHFSASCIITPHDAFFRRASGKLKIEPSLAFRCKPQVEIADQVTAGLLALNAIIMV